MEVEHQVKQEESPKNLENPEIKMENCKIEEDDEGVVREVMTPDSHSDDDDSENYSQNSSFTLLSRDPDSIDFNTWKESVGGLIRKETTVFMESDDELRAAITEAMFLVKASENLVKKRTRQIELLDECRQEEGETAKKLFSEVQPVLRRNLGLGYMEMEAHLNMTIAKSKQPLASSAPDTSRPPPIFSGALPSMNIPPPCAQAPIQIPPPAIVQEVQKQQISPPDILQNVPMPKVVSEIPKKEVANAPKPLMSQHLLPPPIVHQTPPFTRSEEPKKHELHETPSSVSPPPPSSTSSSALPSTQPSFRPFSLVPAAPPLSDSWRKPFHLPTPLPPPSPFHFDPPSRLQMPPPSFRASAAANLRGGLPPAISASNSSMVSTRSPHSPRPSSSASPGLVGVNVRGVFVGNGTPSEVRIGSNGPFSSTGRR